jgi:hypothetical protein
VFFFAGHGISAPLQVGERVDTQAYIVPVDVKDFPDTRAATRQYLQIEDLLEQLAELEVRHVLAIFDACETGIALNERNGLKTRGSGTNFSEPDVLMRRTSRHVITSATETQKAFDENEQYPGNSLFTGWLLEGFRRAVEGGTGEEESPDGDANGSLTVSEIAQFVATNVSRESQDRQTPDHGTFQLDQRGELVIELETDPFFDLFRLAEEYYDEGKIEQLNRVVADAMAMRDADPHVSYLRYLRASENGDDGEALQALQELDAYRIEGHDIPMSPGPLRNALRRPAGTLHLQRPRHAGTHGCGGRGAAGQPLRRRRALGRWSAGPGMDPWCGAGARGPDRSSVR